MRQCIIGALMAVACAPAMALEQLPLAVNAYVCDFDGVALAVAPDGGVFQSEKPEKGFSITYAAIDLSKGTAQMIGNIGTSDVTVIRGGNLISFVEVTPFGNVTMTSVILPLGQPMVPRHSSAAVFSRHIAQENDLVASQFLGSCAPRY